MAAKKSAKVEAQAVETQVENTNAELKFTVGKLRAKSIILFGVSTSTFDGAMYGHKESEYTINEVRTIINEWLNGKEGKK